MRLQEKIKSLAGKFLEDPSCDLLLEIEHLVDKELERNPHDVDLWMLLGVVVYTVPMADYPKTIECLQKVLSYEPNNLNALLFLAYVEDVFYGVTENALMKLKNFKAKNDTDKSMIKFAQSWYYRQKNDPLYEQLLRESIDLCPKLVWPSIKLGLFYTHHDRYLQGKEFIKKGIENIQKVGEPVTAESLFSIEELIGDLIKGTQMGEMNYGLVLEYLEKPQFVESLLKKYF